MSSKLESLIGEEGITAFFTELKNALQTTEKTNEKSLIDFSIKGGENPSGSSIEIISVDANQYTNYISEEKDYMNGAVTVITLSIGAKDAASIGIWENLFNQCQGSIKEILALGDNSSIFFRAEGMKICVDVVIKSDSMNNQIQEYGFNLSDFNSFKLLIKSDLVPGDLFGLTFEQVAIKALTLLLNIKGEIINGKYLSTCLFKALSVINVESPIIQKQITKIKIYASLLKVFQEFVCSFKFSPEDFIKAVIIPILEKDALPGKPIEEEYKEFISGMIAGGQGQLKPMLEESGIINAVKNIDFDEINLNIICHSVKAGIVLSIQLPGITEVLNTQILS